MPSRFGRAGVLVPALAAALSLGSCAETTPASGQGGELTVFAASSLSRPFSELAEDFEAAHPGTTVRLNFAGSSDLAAQLAAGAPADVFAAADETNMARVMEADLAAAVPADFATNTLTIAVPPGNPAGITGFDDLAAPGVQVVMCAVQVPCGAAAERIESASGTSLSPVSEESSVAGVLGKVSSGEADAGLVYVTDVKAAGTSVEEVPVPEAAEAVNRYPIVRLSASGNGDRADAFIQYVVGPSGQSVLREAGFGAP
ncbi:molybdate ABC transporter substrate-binding protein [Arthrobacter sp. 7Tela_A1]|uniref:molybdate ABC transporter substrate-binding protein n=1 Tax=Arthrobacter sp. 7Tela_A1 TaxID=3093745 RepID=UPI003BB7A414